MILAGIYMKLIEIQNSFINKIINSTNENSKNYSKLFIIKIMAQDCNKDEIIDLPSFDDDNNLEINNFDNDIELNYDKDNNNYNNDKIDLMKIIISNSYYYKNNYMEYNFDSIEDILASNILPRIKSFYSEENCLRTVIYQYEGFRGNKNNNINKYIEKYEQRKLSEEEINIVVDYILKAQKNQNFSIKNFLFSFQILIDIILTNTYDKNKSLYKIILNIDDNSNISLIKNFFNRIKIEEEYNDAYFTVNCLIDLMNLIEMFCWETIKNNINKDYLIQLNDIIKSKLDNIFNNNNILITKELLCTAIRRFISRYLLGKRDENEINSKNNLYHYLDKNELWPTNFLRNEKYKEELNNIFQIDKNNIISVNQAMKLYEYLGGDLNNLEKIIQKRNEEVKNKNKNKMKEEEEENNNKNIINEKNDIKNKINDDEKIENEIKDDEEEIEEEEEEISQENEEFYY
jgi:hypothetical protein